MKPQPDFTIEELLKEAITERQETEANIFRTVELAKLWGFQDTETVHRHMDRLTEAGWQFIPARKNIRDRSGRGTSTSAYKILPPENTEAPE